MGLSMIGMWLLFYATGGIPEIQNRPVEIGMHITAEIVAALALITGGAGIYTGRRWGFQLYLISMGMLIYTLIVSPGYFAEKGEWGFVVMFTAFLIPALIFASLSLLRRAYFEDRPKNHGNLPGA